MIRTARRQDLGEYRRMRKALWPDSTDAEAEEVLGRLPSEYAVFVRVRPDGRLSGFAEVGTRAHAEGCITSPVAYLEGIWVDPDARRSSVGQSLVRAAEAWARSRGLTELASDCAADDEGSRLFHRASGFDEVGRIVCFRRALSTDGP